MASLRIFGLMLAALLSACTANRDHVGLASSEPLKVMVIASLHSRHDHNPLYSYDDLYDRIRAFAPSVIGVEIRPEDIGSDGSYLARNYPLEMRVLAEKYADRVKGIDWLGSDLAGRPVPANYWRDQSEIKKLSQALSNETDYSDPAMDAAQKRQLDIIATATPASLNDGRYDDASRDYYAQFARLVAGTRYEKLTSFYAERDRKIAANAADVVAQELESGKAARRIVFVVGADHHGLVVEELNRRFGPSIELVPVP